MRYLILENNLDLEENYTFKRYVESLKATGHEVRCIFNAYTSAEQIIKQVEWPDKIAFTSTFVYIHSIFELTQAIGKFRKAPLEIQIMHDSVAYQVDRLVKLYAEEPKIDGEDKHGNPTFYYHYNDERAEQFGYMLKHISVSSVEYENIDGYKVTPVETLSELAAKWQFKLDTDRVFLQSRQEPESLTGRMIRIKPGILRSSPGPKWKNLRPGLLVPELSMLGASERIAGTMTDRGAWVMGVGEPVKILSSEGYDEFEYVVRDIEDLVFDLLKVCGKGMNPRNYFFVLGVLKDESEDMTPHWKATYILDEFGTPRRGFRAEMERKIVEFESGVGKVTK